MGYKMKGYSYPGKSPLRQETKKGDLSKMSFFSKERIAEYKKRGWAPDHTTDPNIKEKKTEVKKIRWEEKKEKEAWKDPYYFDKGKDKYGYPIKK